jgi:hypothetical protein
MKRDLATLRATPSVADNGHQAGTAQKLQNKSQAMTSS